MKNNSGIRIFQYNIGENIFGNLVMVFLYIKQLLKVYNKHYVETNDSFRNAEHFWLHYLSMYVFKMDVDMFN